MRNITSRTRRLVSYFAILAVVFCALVLAPKLSRAHADGNSINVTNNTSHNILHLYTAPPTTERWSSDQLNDATLTSGQSFTLSNVSCTETGIKLIAEDQDGCFVSAVVSCTENAAWSITNDLTPDCGN